MQNKTNAELATQIQLLKIAFDNKKKHILKEMDELDKIENEFNSLKYELNKRLNPK